MKQIMILVIKITNKLNFKRQLILILVYVYYSYFCILNSILLICFLLLIV